MNESTATSIVAGRITAEDISQALRPLVPATHRVVLFGSRATGRASPRSDWDVGVIGPGPVDGAVLERMREALEELPTLRTFDVVDLTTAAPELRARALHEGMTLA